MVTSAVVKAFVEEFEKSLAEGSKRSVGTFGGVGTFYAAASEEKRKPKKGESFVLSFVSAGEK